MAGPPWSLIIAALLGGAVVSAQLQRECGHASANGQAFIVNGRNATVSESPWHVGLYLVPNNYEQVCGGTLIHPRVVVTAAHCLYGKALYGKLLDAKDLKVSIGSALRDWSRTSGGHVQHLNVSRLVPHHRYRGRGRLFADDIGLLILEKPVGFSAYVEPACMDWSGADGPAVATGSVGKVVGWGATGTGGKDPSAVLQAADLPFIPFEKCSETVPADFLPFLTHDKFCAGHVNGATVAPGDSGGGLTFERDGLWFLMGVVSVGAPHQLTYSAFTNVTAFSDWIRNFVTAVEQGESSLLAAENEGSTCVADSGLQGKCSPLADCPSALEEVRAGGRPQICVFSSTNPIVCCTSPNDTTSSFLPSQQNRIDGTIARAKCREYSQFVFTNVGGKTEDQCMQNVESLVGDWSAQPKEFPHVAHIGLIDDKSKDVLWSCGGTLISPNFVMTVAHCVTNERYRVRWVRLGTVHSDMSDSDDHPQVIAVAERIVHPDYKNTLQYNDIALLRLQKPAEINAYVRPACLHTEPSVPAVPVPVFTGWGTFDQVGEQVSTLKKLAIPVADHAKCNETYSKFRDKKLPLGIVAESQLCAGGKGRDSCQGDSGSPLQVPTRNPEPYCMHKVVGFPSFGTACRMGNPSVYTRVSYFVPWIEKVVWPPPPQVGIIARQKCQEYSQLVFDENGKDHCGVYAISLLGDWEAQPNEYPHMAGLGYRKSGSSETEWNGGGSLISPNFVLTAASVLTSPTGGEVRVVRLGSVLRDGKSDAGQVIEVTERLPHPDYRPPAAYIDIALLRLSRPARLGESVRPACLHTAPSLAAKEVAVATGWGAFAFNPNGSPPETLKKVGLPEVAAEACGRGYPAGDKLLPRGLQPRTQLCAGGKGRDVCAGDAGGPLQLVTHNGSASAEPYCMHKIVGVTSARPTCGTGRAGLFARVYHFVPWIESVVWPDQGAALPPRRQQQSEAARPAATSSRPSSTTRRPTSRRPTTPRTATAASEDALVFS